MAEATIEGPHFWKDPVIPRLFQIKKSKYKNKCVFSEEISIFREGGGTGAPAAPCPLPPEPHEIYQLFNSFSGQIICIFLHVSSLLEKTLATPLEMGTTIPQWKYGIPSDLPSQAPLGLVSTWMGDRLGTPGVVLKIFHFSRLILQAKIYAEIYYILEGSYL